MTLKIKVAAAFHTSSGLVADTPSRSEYASYRVETGDDTYKLYVTSGYRPAGIAVTTRVDVESGSAVFMNGYRSESISCEKPISEGRVVKPYLVKMADKNESVNNIVKKGSGRLATLSGYSYCYFRQPNGKVLLYASTDESFGYTVFKYDKLTSELKISRDIAGVETLENYEAISLFCAFGDEDEVFDRWFANLKERDFTHAERLVGYSTKKLAVISDRVLTRRIAQMQNFPVRANIFLIEGNYCEAGDWLNCSYDLFANGLKDYVRSIHSCEMMAGIAISPFTASGTSEVVIHHPDWILRDADGIVCKTRDGRYVLDSTNARVLEYVHDTVRTILFMWGFDLIKFNDMYAAAPLPHAGKSRGEIMCDAMKFLRRCCGGKLMYVDNSPLMPAFGIADYCAVSSDMVTDIMPKLLSKTITRESASVKGVSSSIAFRRQLNNRAFLNSPCEISLDDKEVFYDNKIYAREQNLISTLGGLFAPVVITTDSFERYPQSKRRRFKKICSLERAENVAVNSSGKEFFVSYKIDGKSYILKF